MASKVQVTIELDDKGALSKITGIDQALDKVGKTGSKSFDVLGMSISKSVAGWLSLGTAVTAVGKFMVDATRSTAKYADELSKMSQAYGVAASEISKWKLAAEISNASLESVGKALAKLSDDAIKHGTTMQEELLNVADRFRSMKDGAEKTALAVKMFGERIGPDLIPFLNLGREGLAGYAEEAKRLGTVMTEDAIKAADLFDDNLTRLDHTVQGLKISIGNSLIPVLNELSDMFFSPQSSAGTNLWNALMLSMSMQGPTAGLVGDTAYWAQQVAASETKRQAERAAGQPGTSTGTFDAKGDDMAVREALAKLADQFILDRIAAVMAPWGGGDVLTRVPGATPMPMPYDIMAGTPAQGLGSASIPPGGTNDFLGYLTMLTPEALAPQFSAMTELGSMFGSLTEKTGLWGDVLAGVGDIMGEFSSGQASLGEAAKRMAVSIISSIAAQSAVKAVFEMAEGFAALANPLTAAQAAAHFTAAKFYGSVAAVAGVAGAVLSGGSSGVGPRGGAFNPVTTTTSSMSLDLSSRTQQNAEITRLNATISKLEKKISTMKPSDVVTVASDQGGIMKYAQPRQDYRAISTRVYDEPLI